MSPAECLYLALGDERFRRRLVFCLAVRIAARRMLAVAIVLVVMALLGALAGCGGGDPEDFEAAPGHDKTLQPVDPAASEARR